MSDKTEHRLITVCDNCLQATCWQGIFMCWESRNAGTVDLPISKLQELNLEHSSYWQEKPIAFKSSGKFKHEQLPARV